MANNPRILVVDDEPTITEFVSFALQQERYSADTASSGEQALEMMEQQAYDLFILDIVMPNGIDGFELCRRIRANTDAPVLFLSSRDSELDKVLGLELGADDYLTKPFGMRELLARVHALLRRAEGLQQANQPLAAAGITLDKSAHTATYNSNPIKLTPREFELLASLMSHAGEVVKREDLLREAWGWEYITETKTVDTHIKRLRAKLENEGIDPRMIETVRGYGYRIQP
ncbi:MAG: response regulator transcription factor [Coriobacteriia bacterium]|nr:response regulator transcription factor [Coriobacteriia bacterium]